MGVVVMWTLVLVSYRPYTTQGTTELIVIGTIPGFSNNDACLQQGLKIKKEKHSEIEFECVNVT
jgi:hypothetical protein